MVRKKCPQDGYPVLSVDPRAPVKPGKRRLRATSRAAPADSEAPVSEGGPRSHVMKAFAASLSEFDDLYRELAQGQ